MTTAQRVVLASRPATSPDIGNLRLEEFTPAAPGPGEVALRTLWLSIDPYMLRRMSDAPSYAPPVPLGAVMEGRTVSEVIESKLPDLRPGDIVFGTSGWQSHAVSDGRGLRKVDPTIAPVSTALGVLGMPGLTAYAGLAEIGQPKPGETLVVGAASGAVGSIVGQIARIRGARAIGIAGGAEKCRFVREELGFDHCLDHRASDLAGRLKEVCPKGVDVYFENIGGAVFDAVLPLLNNFARVPLCGLMAQYTAGPPTGPDRVPQLIRTMLTKRITMRGFLVSDFAAREGEFRRDMAAWLREGRVKYRESVIDGLANAPQALIGLMRGENFGKTVVRVARDAI